MKVLVYTGFDNNNGFNEIGKLSAQNKFEYAQRHNYDFLCVKNYHGYDRPISWFKIQKIIQLLPQYDWIFWSDADALIMNQTIRVEDIISINIPRRETIRLSPRDTGSVDSASEIKEISLPPLEETNYIISQDEYSPCMGNFLIRDSRWSRLFFECIYNSTQFLNDNLWDNRAQDYLFHLHPNEYLTKTKFFPKSWFNAFYYEPSNFIVHFPATEPLRRLRYTNEFLQKVIK
jgi:hypothetical protein